MNINLILENLPLFSSSPDRVESLRKLIYKLAASGALSGQKSIEKRPDFKATMGESEIPINWIWCELQEIAIFGGRGSIKPELIPEDSWLLDLEDIEKVSSKLLVRTRARDRRTTSNKAIFREGDVLYGKLRPYLDKVLVADMSGYCTTEIVAIQPHHGLDPRWLRICLKRPEFIAKVTELSYGTKMPRLGTDDAKKSLHPIPPLEEQRRIVSEVEKLLELCDQIEDASKYAQIVNINTRKSAADAISIARTPEELRIAWQRIQDNWEVIAVTPESIESLRNLILSLAISGNLTSSFSPQDTMQELLENVDKRINPYPEMSDERFVIPSHWKWVALASIAEHQLGKMLQTSRRDGVRTKYLRTANLKSDGSIDLSNLKEMFIPESEISKYSVLKGDIFINEGGEVGRSAIYQDESYPNLAFQNHLHRLRTYRGIENQYIHFVLKQAKNHGVIAAMSSGVTIQNFSANSLRRLAIPLPPTSEQKLIVEKVNQLMKICDELEIGMLRVSDIAEKFVRSVVSITA